MPAKLQVEKYRLALARLVTRGGPINLDSVAREAGSGAGSIKRSRKDYADLIKEIDAASVEPVNFEDAGRTEPSQDLKKEVKRLSALLDESLERELNLLEEVYTLREENRELRVGRPLIVVPPSARSTLPSFGQPS
ncbi:hypothetical protein [Pseudorhodoferax soli]|uniref:hypothetical protein n=1 Tax=Pseudorhodoferax soli TaxID=545864 RepID=UPI001B87FBE7|nr:hypothetical protein [Pseudorhodoferax soli]